MGGDKRLHAGGGIRPHRVEGEGEARKERGSPAGGASVGDALLAQRGGVVGLHSEAEWNAALELTKGAACR